MRAGENQDATCMVDLFLDYLRYERNKSELTVLKYAAVLRDFEAFYRNMDGQVSWTSVDSDIIRDWMEDMMEKGKKASTISGTLPPYAPSIVSPSPATWWRKTLHTP